MSGPLGEVRARLDEARTDWAGRRANLAATWSDARARAVDAAHLAPTDAGLEALRTQVGRQQEADDKARGLCRIVDETSAAAEQSMSEASAAQEEARSHDAAARSAAGEATAHAASGRAAVTDAVRLVGAAGQGCGQAMGSGKAAAAVERSVRQTRQLRELRRLGRAFVVEAAWTVGPELAGRLAGRVTGVDGWQFDGVRGAWDGLRPVLYADVADVVKLGLRR